jgi:hypothetical protein
MNVNAPPGAAPSGSPAATGAEGTLVVVAAAASAGAGLVHLAAAVSHREDRALLLLFAATAAVQLAWATLAVARPHRLTVAIGIGVNGAAVAAWALSRTVGLPIVESLGSAEAVGLPDLLAAVLAAVACALTAAALAIDARRETDEWPSPAPMAVAIAGVLALTLAVPGMAASHTHGDHRDHDEVATADHHGGPGHVAHPAPPAHNHTEGMDHGADQPAGHTSHQRRAISFDDPRLTPEQRSRARDLFDRTIAAMTPYTDESRVVAAGYQSIGDSISGFEHFVHHDYRDDGIELDPERVEALVFETKIDQPKRLVAAMFILEPDKTMADVPEIAGSLTTWHLHDDLCWDSTSTRITGLFRDGRCTPGGTLRVSSPMLHVWPEPQECGPFAEADTFDIPLARVGRSDTTTTTPAEADPCMHEHGGH